MKSVLFAIVFLGLITLPAMGFQADVENIPNGSVFSCDTCHSTNTNFLNDFSQTGHSWTSALAQKDSDGDGWTNGQELQDPAGNWQPGEANPGNQADVTNPSDPSSHPSDPTATPTNPPAETPTPTNTPTPTPTNQTPIPTATPGACTSTGVRIVMPADYFRPGNQFYCHAVVCNAEGENLIGYPLFVILDIAGQYFFAPTFISYDNYIDQYNEFPMGETQVIVLDSFAWPEGAGSMNQVTWYAALTDPNVQELVGDFAATSFGWGE